MREICGMFQENLHAAFVPADEHPARQGEWVLTPRRKRGEHSAAGEPPITSSWDAGAGGGVAPSRSGLRVSLARNTKWQLPACSRSSCSRRVRARDRLAVMIRRTGARQGLDEMLSSTRMMRNCCANNSGRERSGQPFRCDRSGTRRCRAAGALSRSPVRGARGTRIRT